MIADIIHKLAEFENKEDSKFYPRPSLAGPDRCIRQMVYWGLGFPRTPFSGRTLLVFDDGTWHEELTFDWLRKSSFKVHSEQMVVNCLSPMKRGHIDALITTITKEDIHVEHKGLNHFTFQKLWDGEDPVDYLTQTAIYNEAIQRELNPNCKKSILLIKNKNTAQYLEFLCEYLISTDVLILISKTLSTGETVNLNRNMPSIVKNACDKFNETLDYIKKKTLPRRPYFIDDWHCNYCGWGEHCWSGYRKEFEELRTNELLPNEVADTIRYYKELGGQKKDIEAEYETLKNKVKQIMKESSIREGVAGEYICKLSLVEKRNLDKSMLSVSDIEKATTKTFYEKLNISKRRAA